MPSGDWPVETGAVRVKPGAVRGLTGDVGLFYNVCRIILHFLAPLKVGAGIGLFSSRTQFFPIFSAWISSFFLTARAHLAIDSFTT
jgi:hypothetical protein